MERTYVSTPPRNDFAGKGFRFAGRHRVRMALSQPRQSWGEHVATKDDGGDNNTVTPDEQRPVSPSTEAACPGAFAGISASSHSGGHSESAPPPLSATIGIEADAWTCVVPIPDNAFPLEARLEGQDPRTTYIYRDGTGNPLGVECHFVSPNGTDVRFAAWCRHTSGVEAWRLKHLPPPWPLYGIDRLAKQPDAPVVIVPGAMHVPFATKRMPQHCVIAWPGELAEVASVEWSPLKGRTVVISPSIVEGGREAAVQVAEHAARAGAEVVSLIASPTELSRNVGSPGRATAVAPRQASIGKVKPVPSGQDAFQMTERGLVWRDPKRPDTTEGFVVSGPFEVIAHTRDEESRSWGILLQWRDRDGVAHEHCLPRSVLIGDDRKVARLFSDNGLHVGAGAKARALLVAFLTEFSVNARVRMVSRTGWYGSAFLLPDGVIGRIDGERFVLRSHNPATHAYSVAGDFATWRNEVARYAIGNSRLAFAISMAFAAALVGPCGAEGGGVHLRGRSSIGKTTALVVAGSVWGGGDHGYVRTWDATKAALEMVAVEHNETLLCLDEIAQLSAPEAGKIAYSLANGEAKARANRGAKLQARWRLLFLSSGEIGLAEKVAEHSRGTQITAGQQVRVADLPADTGSVHGLFEQLHGFSDAGSFAQHLTRTARTTYGHAARVFIEAVTGDLAAVRDTVAQDVAAFLAKCVPSDADGQVTRVANRFAFIAASGELATAKGVLPWQTGEATRAAEACLAAWLEARGGVEAFETRDGFNALRRFLTEHGSTRFMDWEAGADDLIPGFLGFRRRTPAGFDYYLTSAAWDNALEGFDRKLLSRALAERGFLLPDPNSGQFAAVARPPGRGVGRYYHLAAALIDDPRP